MSAKGKELTQTIDSLTGIRGFAAIWVVLYHLRTLFAKALPDWPILNLFIDYGYLGVDLFSFLSGFIIAYVYSERLQSASWSSARRYLWLRFVRTYPLHLFILGLFVIVLIYKHGWYSLSVFPYETQFFRQLLLINGLGIETLWKWNVPSWTLSAEWACYIVFPLLAPFIFRTTNGYIAALLAAITLGATIGCMTLLGHPDFDVHLDWGFIRIAGEFFTGCWMYQLYKSGLLANWRMGLIGALALTVSIVALLVFEWVPVTVIGFAIFIIALAHDQQPLHLLFGNRVSVYLGEISFSIYMIHWLIISNSELWGISDIDIQWRIPALLALTLISAAITFHLVEQTTRRKLRNIIR